MNNSLPNLFEALFQFHPRDGHTPKENFLTESFAYLLRTDEGVRNRWLSRLLSKDIKDVTCDISTRQTERNLDADSLLFPDLLIEGQFSDGERFAVFCEHKWDSPCNCEQLARYRKLAKSRGTHARLVFLGANYKQKSDAEKCFQDKSCKCLLWQDVFNALDSIADKSPLLMEFLGFMKTQGLSPGQPLTVERMKAFLQASGFLESLMNLANKLNTDFSWVAIPERFRAEPFVTHGYGKVAIRFPTEEYKPWIAVGFYYDERDHKVSLVNPNRGIDIILRIAAEPKYTKNIQPAMSVLEAKRKELRKTAASVLLKGERGNGNTYSLLIVHDCLADVIEGANTEAHQLAAIYARLTKWLHILFDDGSLEKGFRKSNLDSGMK